MNCEICGKEHSPLSWQKNKCYSCRVKENQQDVQRQIVEGEITEVDCENEIYCPWCGCIYEIDDEYDLYDDGEHDGIECPECERKFTVTTNVSYSFDTKRGD